MELAYFTGCRGGLHYGKSSLKFGKLHNLQNLEFSRTSQEEIALTTKESHQDISLISKGTHHELSLYNCTLPVKTMWRMSKGASLKKLQLVGN